MRRICVTHVCVFFDEHRKKYRTGTHTVTHTNMYVYVCVQVCVYFCIDVCQRVRAYACDMSSTQLYVLNMRSISLYYTHIRIQILTYPFSPGAADASGDGVATSEPSGALWHASCRLFCAMENPCVLACGAQNQLQDSHRFQVLTQL